MQHHYIKKLLQHECTYWWTSLRIKCFFTTKAQQPFFEQFLLSTILLHLHLKQVELIIQVLFKKSKVSGIGVFFITKTGLFYMLCIWIQDECSPPPPPQETHPSILDSSTRQRRGQVPTAALTLAGSVPESGPQQLPAPLFICPQPLVCCSSAA